MPYIAAAVIVVVFIIIIYTVGAFLIIRSDKKQVEQTDSNVNVSYSDMCIHVHQSRMQAFTCIYYWKSTISFNLLLSDH